METLMVGCGLLIVAGFAVFVLLGIAAILPRLAAALSRSMPCARCGQPVTYFPWRRPPWCPACQTEVWRAA